MSHPQDPYGPPQDPYQQNQDPATAPVPPWPADPTAPPPLPPTTAQPPVSGAGYPPPPVSGAPYPPPVSGAPYQPTSGSPYQPTSGSPYQPGGFTPPPTPDPTYQPGVEAAYPPPPGPAYPPPPGGSYPPGPGYAPGPGYPLGPPARKSSKKPIVIIVVIVVVLALLCCVGGIVALVTGANEAAKEAERQFPDLPRVTTAPSGLPSAGPTSSSSSAPADGETFNMKAGDSLVITDDDGTLEITVLRFRTSTKGCKSYSPDPDKGLYLIADVTATVKRGNMSINPFYFQWVAEDGTTANGIAGALAGCGDLLDSGVNLREGSKRTGSVTFDVTNKNGELEYRHKLETAGSWKP
ncbi:protein of unknown function [Micromonospora haikouensis]|uniref:DUF4352 domain-containing protein n=1 Tax=Micromonospora haikouensis TaxID=686309 RepID=A0A1C4X647_9ACTN|nr:DUF4352 domain-containing protein [Micromonospora haikouensis]SCF03927.1 protein of unknown function [Micromonospora haikouensis]